MLFPANCGAGNDVVAAADPTSKDIKGILGFAVRGGWNGAVGRRRCAAAGPGFPPDGKTTGGTLNSLDIGAEIVKRISSKKKKK